MITVKFSRGTVWSLAVFLSAFACAGLHAATFFVAQQGDDTYPGTRDRPLASPAAARDAARGAGSGPHTIKLLPGDYFLEQPLTLDARDKGLTFEGAVTNGPLPTLFGGRRVTGWTRDGDQCWQAHLPGVREGAWDFRALVVNGRLAERAVLPGSNTFENLGTWNLPLLPAVAGHWERKPTREEATTMPYKTADLPPTLDIRNAEVRLYHMWAESLVGVASNDLQRHALILASEPAWPPGALNRRKYVVYNTREGMTRPGQWYLDRTAGRLVYWPLPGERMENLTVIAPTAESILRITGSPREPAEGITVRRLAFQATTAPLKPASFGATAFDGAVTVAHARDCVFDQLDICNAGGLGFRADTLNGSRVTGCRIRQTGACGARIHGTDTLIASNHIHHLGIYYPSAAATMLGGYKVHIYRNEIHDAPYSGIIGGGGRENVIEENLIYRVMRELHDGAAIYGNMTACIIRGNMVRDVVQAGAGFGASAYYLDEGARDCIVERNVAIGVPMPTHNHITRNITVRDNVFISDTDMTVSFQRSVGCTFENNTLFVPGKLHLRQPNGIASWKGNVIYREGGGQDGVPQRFTISDSVPLPPPPARKTYAAEAVRVSVPPVIDGEMAVGEWPGKLQTLDREPTRHAVGGSPTLVKIAYDDRHLYVAANVTLFGPAKVSTNAVWGLDDGVEIALAGKTQDGRTTAFVLRGFAGGALLSVTDAGAPEDAATRLARETRFAARPAGGPGGALFGKGWRGEWAIPLAALGLTSANGQLTGFNMAAFYSEFRDWHCWEGTQAESWRIEQAGTLLFK